MAGNAVKVVSIPFPALSNPKVDSTVFPAKFTFVFNISLFKCGTKCVPCGMTFTLFFGMPYTVFKILAEPFVITMIDLLMAAISCISSIKVSFGFGNTVWKTMIMGLLIAFKSCLNAISFFLKKPNSCWMSTICISVLLFIFLANAG